MWKDWHYRVQCRARDTMRGTGGVNEFVVDEAAANTDAGGGCRVADVTVQLSGSDYCVMALVGWDMVCSIPTTLDIVPSGVATGPTAEPTAEPTAARAAAPSAAHLVRQLSVSVPDDNNYWHIMYSFFFSVSRVAGMHCS